MSLGVWYQAKTITRDKIALKALYTIYQGLTNDLYYRATMQAVQQGLNETVFNQYKYFSKEKVKNLLYDSDYGLYQ